MQNKKTTSWEPVQKWYRGLVEDQGHYYHKQIILPNLLKMIGKDVKSLLDLACGTGVLANVLPSSVNYLGVDISASFIKAAKQKDKNPNHEYLVADATKTLRFSNHDFSHATLILAAQNIEKPLLAFQNVARHLMKGGKFIVVLNHPCFRIPRQSSWGIDDKSKIQYRRIDSYMSEMKIPIHAHPSQKDASASTLSFHYPLSTLVNWLHEAGFVVERMEEWCSDKTSTGKNAKMENRSRQEIPLFLTLVSTIPA